jgi:hypothetical protein
MERLGLTINIERPSRRIQALKIQGENCKTCTSAAKAAVILLRIGRG